MSDFIELVRGKLTLDVIEEITVRNLKAVEEIERKSKRIADVYYYKGKADALSHILELVEESRASNQS